MFLENTNGRKVQIAIFKPNKAEFEAKEHLTKQTT